MSKKRKAEWIIDLTKDTVTDGDAAEKEWNAHIEDCEEEEYYKQETFRPASSSRHDAIFDSFVDLTGIPNGKEPRKLPQATIALQLADVKAYPNWKMVAVHNGDICSICACKHRINSMVELPCAHQFGFECISTWVDKRKKNSCPLCKKRVI